MTRALAEKFSSVGSNGKKTEK